MKKQTYELTGFNYVKERLIDYTSTRNAAAMVKELEPYISESDLRKNLRDTTYARECLENIGTPPLPCMEDIEEKIGSAVRGELLQPEDIEEIGVFLVAVKRMKSYLQKGIEKQISLAYYDENLISHQELIDIIQKSIRNGRVDDYASSTLRDIRRNLEKVETSIKEKAEKVMRAGKQYMADSFIVKRNNHVCVPVKAQFKTKVAGVIVDKSSTGSTLFIEPSTVGKLCEERDILLISEDCEERRILYELIDIIAGKAQEILENSRVISFLDFVFAKAKLSVDMDGVEPDINLNGRIVIRGARHPMINKEECVPLDFDIGNGINGVIITGPNTGGKTVSIKTIGLMSIMAGAGLHVPCVSADISMNSQVLCDIGDGQNISDNLSTFSAHIGNILNILRHVNKQSLVILDELGSGTDPAEGMGFAIAILEQLRKCGCLFLVTTHYPEVKEYALKHSDIINARMEFDRDSLKPLYRLEIGKAGESCALYIAKKLGVPADILNDAADAAYGVEGEKVKVELGLDEIPQSIKKESAPTIHPIRIEKRELLNESRFSRGDCVVISPEGCLGIVVKPDDSQGNVVVQIKKEKRIIKHTRLKLKVKAEELYPEDYDFSIIFDTVANRKARKKMSKHYQEDIEIRYDGLECTSKKA